MESSHQRRKLINFAIKKEMQLRIISWIFIIVFLSLLACGSIFYHYSNKKIDSTYKQFHVQLYNMKQVLAPWILFAVSFGATLALSLTLFYPKKIAGPLYRLEKRVNEIASGNLKDTVKLRPRDELQDLAKELNLMGAKLQGKLLSAKNILQEMDSIINIDLHNSNSQKAINRLQEEIAQLKAIFNEFTL